MEEILSNKIKELEKEIEIEKTKVLLYENIIQRNLNICIKDDIDPRIDEIIQLVFTDKKKKPIFKTFKKQQPEELQEDVNIIIETEKQLEERKKEFTSLQEAEPIFDECFNNIKNEKKFDNDLLTIKNTRLNIIGLLNIDDYIKLLRKHHNKLINIFTEKGRSLSYANKQILKSMTSIDVRLIQFKPLYIDVELKIDDLIKLKTSLELSVEHTKDFIPFCTEHFLDKFKNYGTCVISLKDCIKMYLFNIYKKNNYVYIHLDKSTEEDPFSFYYLKSTNNNKRQWIMDCRLESLSDSFTEISDYLVDMFKNIYYDIFSHNNYSSDFLENASSLNLDLEQIIKNIIWINNKCKFNKELRHIVRENATYIVSSIDKRNHESDDTNQRNRFKNRKDSCPVDVIQTLFDDLSTEDAVDFYRRFNSK